ncbi:uncharacterized protein EV420DRAFT_1735085 [Desarmillaria tabescens]|uniref:Uncharacterized protein n=1 Tax=Armillaria tabescens TaxID=1929756 RepID=A0AA39NBM5_ARMTA|nr:uncharacterized protein EV420DRAFT_1735085 [Desarmillaria tabescens]KAK0462533.1 hypothetical protein EV420DRAFT_1735085 [Desarmillaria tabescens]
MVAIEEEQEASAQEVPQPEEKDRVTQTGKVDWMHPFAMTCSETKLELLTKLLLAVLVVEYKKPTQTYAKALVQAKMYPEASVRYLASLGVTRKVFSRSLRMALKGPFSWRSVLATQRQAVYIVERNVQTFNISSPIEVYHFVTVLLRLREYGDTTLKDAVEEALMADGFKQTSWSKTAQFNMMEQD